MKATPELRRALPALARKASRRVPELYEDLLQEAFLTLHLLEPDDTVLLPVAWARQACWNRMMDYLRSRRHCWRELRDARPNRRHAGLPTWRDHALEEGLDDPPERGDSRPWDLRRIQWGEPWPVVETDALDAVVSAGLVLDRLPVWDRQLLALCFGIEPGGTLSEIAKLVGLKSEAAVRYHRDRIIRDLRQPYD